MHCFSSTDSRARAGNTGLSGRTSSGRPLLSQKKRPKTGNKKKKMPHDLALYLAKKINPVLRQLSTNIFLDQPSDIPGYLSDFATKISVQQYGQCTDIVKALAAAMNNGT